MLSLKSQISILDNFVIREESISPVLAMMNNKETLTEHHSHNLSDNSLKEVSICVQTLVIYNISSFVILCINTIIFADWVQK